MDQAKAGAFIAQLRKEAGLTQAQLGEKLCVGNKTVSRWETGNYMPDLDNCLALSELFGVTVNELLMGQRMDAGEMRQTANQVLVDALHSQHFSLRERTRYWRRKWYREHVALLAFLMAVWLGLLTIVYLLVNRLGSLKALQGGLLCVLGGLLFLFAVCAYGWQHNQMMIYVEKKLYDPPQANRDHTHSR